jgi:hypothetical protein
MPNEIADGPPLQPAGVLQSSTSAAPIRFPQPCSCQETYGTKARQSILILTNIVSKSVLFMLVVWPAMTYSKSMKREDIIRDIHGLDAELAVLEEQYGLLSADFYHFYQAGELEQTRDFIRWAGFYEAKQERETSYRQLVYEHLRELRRRSGLGALALDPAGA